MADITGTETYEAIINYISSVSSMSGQNLADWFKLIEYQGYDPMSSLTKILRIAKGLGLKAPDLGKDMEYVIGFYASGGTNFRRDGSKWKMGAADNVSRIMLRYEILPNLPPGQTGPEVLTVGRVAILFNEIAAAMFACGLSNPVVTSKNVPLWASFPGAASLINDEEWIQWGDEYVELMADFSMIVTKGKDKQGKSVSRETLLNQQKQFASIARSSGFAKANLNTKRKAYNKLLGKYVVARKALDGVDVNPIMMRTV